MLKQLTQKEMFVNVKIVQHILRVMKVWISIELKFTRNIKFSIIKMLDGDINNCEPIEMSDYSLSPDTPFLALGYGSYDATNQPSSSLRKVELKPHKVKMF